MSKDRLDEIRKRCEKVTPGPWSSFGQTIENESINLKDFQWVSAGARYECTAQEGTDAEFIAHAREDVPFLIGYIEYLYEIGEILITGDLKKAGY